MNYNLQTIPTTVNDRAEAGLMFFAQLYKKTAGSQTVIEVPNGPMIRAFTSSHFVGEDLHTYYSMRLRMRVDPEWETNGLAIWNSVLHAAPADTAIPLGYGGGA